MSVRDVDVQKVVFCWHMSYDRNIGNAATHLFEMKKTITTVTAKCAYRRGAKDEERGGVAKNKSRIQE